MKMSENGHDWNFIWQNMSDGMSQNPARAYRFSRILHFFPKENNLQVLDFGCGDGELISELLRVFPSNSYFAADTSESAIAITQLRDRRINCLNIELSENGPQLSDPTLRFDVVIISEVLEHIKDEIATLNLIHKMLKPGGLLLCTVPSGPRSQFDRFIGHHRHYTAGTLKQVLANANFKGIYIERSGFPAINLLRLSTIALGKIFIGMIQRNKFGEKGMSGLSVHVLRYLFRYSANDSFFGWQLISTSQKINEVG